MSFHSPRTLLSPCPVVSESGENGVVLYLAVLEGSIHPSPIAVPATTPANFVGRCLE